MFFFLNFCYFFNSSFQVLNTVTLSRVFILVYFSFSVKLHKYRMDLLNSTVTCSYFLFYIENLLNFFNENYHLSLFSVTFIFLLSLIIFTESIFFIRPQNKRRCPKCKSEWNQGLIKLPTTTTTATQNGHHGKFTVHFGEVIPCENQNIFPEKGHSVWWSEIVGF